MEIGVTLRNSGDQSDPETVLGCAQAAEERSFESAWVVDDIAIPPDDADTHGAAYGGENPFWTWQPRRSTRY